MEKKQFLIAALTASLILLVVCAYFSGAIITCRSGGGILLGWRKCINVTVIGACYDRYGNEYILPEGYEQNLDNINNL